MKLKNTIMILALVAGVRASELPPMEDYDPTIGSNIVARFTLMFEGQIVEIVQTNTNNRLLINIRLTKVVEGYEPSEYTISGMRELQANDYITIDLSEDELNKCLDNEHRAGKYISVEGARLRLHGYWYIGESGEKYYDFKECLDDTKWKKLIESKNRQEKYARKRMKWATEAEERWLQFEELTTLFSSGKISEEEYSNRCKELSKSSSEQWYLMDEDAAEQAQQQKVVDNAMGKLSKVLGAWHNQEITKEELCSEMLALCAEYPWMLTMQQLEYVYKLCPDLQSMLREAGSGLD